MRVVIGALIMLSCAGPAAADTPAEARRALAAAQQEDLIGQWQDRYRAAITRETEAQAQLDAAMASYRSARHHNRLRGEEKVETLEALSSARAELKDARRERAEMPDLARRAGLPAGWLRDLEE